MAFLLFNYARQDDSDSNKSVCVLLSMLLHASVVAAGGSLVDVKYEEQ